MAPTYYFISGLPRSGSTLLAAILLQNPTIHAGMHSALAPLWVSMIDKMSTKNEFQAQLNDPQRLEILKGIIENYYCGQQDKKYIFDTSRAWQKWLHVLVKIWPNVKVISCVRDVGWIADSVERMHKERPWTVSRFWEDGIGSATVFDRVNGLQRSGNLVGYGLAALSEGLSSEQSDRILMVDYDLLTEFPRDVMAHIYQWLDIPYFEHDFNNVKFEGNAADAICDNMELHTVRPVVRPNIRKTILPQELFDKMSNLSVMWKGDMGSKAKRLFRREENKVAPSSTVAMPEKARYNPKIHKKEQPESEDLIELGKRVEELFDGQVKVTGPLG